MNNINTFQVYRKQVPLGIEFKAPKNITFGFQFQRKRFSVWYDASLKDDCDYIIIATGEMIPMDGDLIQSYILEDGFTVFHLIKLK